MTIQKNLSCRFSYTHVPFFFFSLGVLFSVYLGVLINYALHHSNPGADVFFGAWLVLGLVALILLPLYLSVMRSTFIFNTEGVLEHKGYLYGLIRGKEIITPWAGYESWDTNYYFIPATRKSIPQINIYHKSNGVLRFNQKFAGNFLNGDKSIQWSTFSKHLIESFNEVDLPHFTPNKEKSMRSLVQNLIIGTAVLIVFLIIVAGVLSIIAGKINWYSVVVVAGFLSVVVSVISGKRK